MKHFKPNKSQMKIIRKHWKTLEQMTSDYYGNVAMLEGFMEQETGIKGIEFIHEFAGGYFGVGNADKTMELIHL